MTHSTIPLNKLRLSERNVRKTNRDEDIASLAEDIAARGLKQNLVVTPSAEKPGLYEVDAGGRRFLALRRLSAEKRIPKNHPVAVLIEEPEQALETSLAENLHRVAMNPADEFEAFATIIAGYADAGITSLDEQVANCARRFGVTPRHVEQRLRLADLHPEILAALRASHIGLEAAKAYGTYPDQDLQLKVFKGRDKLTWGTKHDPKAIRDEMQGKVYRADYRAAVYAGIDNYLAAGGRMVREFFMGAEDADVLLDMRLVDKLAQERAAEEADRFGKQAGFAGGEVKIWSGRYDSWPKAPAGFKLAYQDGMDAPDEERAQLRAIFAISDDGSALEMNSNGFHFAPADAKPVAIDARFERESAEQRAERERDRQVERIAIRLAAPRVAGTPLEGRAYWPADRAWVEPMEFDEERGFYVVALLVTVPVDEVQAARDAAEIEYQRLIDERAAREAAEAAKEAAGEDVIDVVNGELEREESAA